MSSFVFLSDEEEDDEPSHHCFDMRRCQPYYIGNLHHRISSDCDASDNLNDPYVSTTTSFHVKEIVLSITHDQNSSYQYVVCQVIPQSRSTSRIPVSTSMLSLPLTTHKRHTPSSSQSDFAGTLFCICMPPNWAQTDLCEFLLSEHRISPDTVPLCFRNIDTDMPTFSQVDFLRLEHPKPVRILCNIFEFNPSHRKKESYFLDCKSTNTVKEARQILFKSCGNILPELKYPWFFEMTGRLLLENDYIYYGSNSGVLNNAYNDLSVSSIKLECLSLDTVPIRLRFPTEYIGDKYLLCPEIIAIKKLRMLALGSLISQEDISEESVVLKLGNTYTLDPDCFLKWSPFVNELGIRVLIEQPLTFYVEVSPCDGKQKPYMLELILHRFATVKQIKKDVSNRTLCDVKEILLKLKLKELKDNATIKDCDIQNGDVVYAEIHKNRASVPVSVLPLNKTVEVTFNDLSKAEIRHLKEKLSAILNVHSKDIVIRTNDTVLADDCPLGQYLRTEPYYPLLAIPDFVDNIKYFECSEEGVINIRTSFSDNRSGHSAKMEMCKNLCQHRKLIMTVKRKTDSNEGGDKFIVIHEEPNRSDVGRHGADDECKIEVQRRRRGNSESMWNLNIRDIRKNESKNQSKIPMPIYKKQPCTQLYSSSFGRTASDAMRSKEMNFFPSVSQENLNGNVCSAHSIPEIETGSLGPVGLYREHSQSMLNLRTPTRRTRYSSKMPSAAHTYPQNFSTHLPRSSGEKTTLEGLKKVRSHSFDVLDSRESFSQECLPNDESSEDGNEARAIHRTRSVPGNVSKDKHIESRKLVYHEDVVVHEDGVKKRLEKTILTSETDLSKMNQLPRQSTLDNISSIVKPEIRLPLYLKNADIQASATSQSDLDHFMMKAIARIVNKDWKIFARELAIEECDITDLEQSQQTKSPIELCYQSLHFWKEKHNGSKKKLAEMLEKSQFDNIIETFNLRSRSKSQD